MEQNQEAVGIDIDAVQVEVENGRTKATELSLNEAEKSVQMLKGIWGGFNNELLAKIGDTPENREWLAARSNILQQKFINTTYNGVMFIEYFNQYINSGKPIDLPVLYLLNDHMRGFMNHCTGIPLQYQNVVDTSTAGASQDPRWSTDPLPIERIIQAGGHLRIPVKVETFGEIVWGYLELFTYDKQVSGETIKVTCEIPALRVGDQYYTINSIYRWMLISKDDVKERTLRGKQSVKKVIQPKQKTDGDDKNV